MMPYYGETEEENWYLTYPAFQIAANVRAEESPERKQLILDIMKAMLSEEAQRRISSSQNMVPYNREINIDLSPAMSEIQPYIDSNRLYIRLASSDMFSISKQVVQGMISGSIPTPGLLLRRLMLHWSQRKRMCLWRHILKTDILMLLNLTAAVRQRQP